MKILVSDCLLGINCKYNGGNNGNQALLDILSHHTVIGVCPEVLGGLPTPRACAEIQHGRVINTLHEDVTKQYEQGAQITVAKAVQDHVDMAILQSRSPSCGCGTIYDGTFSHKVIPGDGVTVRALRAINIPVFNIEDIENVRQFIKHFEKSEASSL